MTRVATGPDEDRLIIAGILYVISVIGPVAGRWLVGEPAFGPSLGIPYPLLLAGIALAGGTIGSYIGYGTGRVLRAFLFGLVSATVVALVLECYLSVRTTVFFIEFSLLAMGGTATVAFTWKWMERRLIANVGRRVVVVAEHAWAPNALGTVARPPVVVLDGSTAWNGATRIVQPRHAKVRTTWIDFDEPQGQGLERGPFIGAEIEQDLLQPAPSGKAPPPRPREVVGAVWTDHERKRLKLEYRAYARR